MSQSLKKYDSAVFPTIEESIANAKKNPFLTKKSSDSLIMTVDSETVLISEPMNILRENFWMLEEFLVAYPMPEDEHFMPELSSVRTYGTHDLWYVFLLANNCFSMKSYQFKTYKVLPSGSINKLFTFFNISKNTSRYFSAENSIVFK